MPWNLLTAVSARVAIIAALFALALICLAPALLLVNRFGVGPWNVLLMITAALFFGGGCFGVGRMTGRQS